MTPASFRRVAAGQAAGMRLALPVADEHRHAMWKYLKMRTTQDPLKNNWGSSQ